MMRKHKKRIAFLLAVSMILTTMFTGSVVIAAVSADGQDPEVSEEERSEIVYSGPQILNANASTYGVPVGKVKIDVSLSYGSYTENGVTKYLYDTIIELYRNGNRIDKRIVNGDTYSLITDVSYDKRDTFEVRSFMEANGTIQSGKTAAVTIQSSQMGKNSVCATRIDSKTAVIRWNGSEGATGYRIIKGSKIVKNVKASVRKYVVKKKGACKAKFRDLPLLKAEGMTHVGRSNTVKPGSNKVKCSKAKSWRDFKYFTSRFVAKSMSLTGKTYTVKGFFYNSSHRTVLKRYKKLNIKIYADGKRVASKTYRNVKMNLKGEKQKKRTFKFKGKAGADLRNGDSCVVISVLCDPDTFN